MSVAMSVAMTVPVTMPVAMTVPVPMTVTVCDATYEVSNNVRSVVSGLRSPRHARQRKHDDGGTS